MGIRASHVLSHLAHWDAWTPKYIHQLCQARRCVVKDTPGGENVRAMKASERSASRAIHLARVKRDIWIGFYTYINTYTHTHTAFLSRRLTDTPGRPHIQLHIRTHMHARTHAHAHTHLHIHPHTNTYVLHLSLAISRPHI